MSRPQNERHDDVNAFIPESGESPEDRDDLAELLAEDLVLAVTGGDDELLDARDLGEVALCEKR